MAQRTYEDPCGIARALDLLGERWALLVVRELLYGPKRFGDLQRGLAHISQNVLSDRLHELQGGAIVERVRLGPPASTTAYALTGRGRDLRPVLTALGRWGSMLPVGDGGVMSPDAALFALESTFDATADPGLEVRAEVRVAGDVFAIRAGEAALLVRRGSDQGADLVLDIDVEALRDLTFGGVPLAVLVAEGRARCERSTRLAERLFACFPRPAAENAGSGMRDILAAEARRPST
ncbi:MAG: winged helix-turn-helix transcriptional regulator [Candidatus Dormibacteraceae bacterium]